MTERISYLKKSTYVCLVGFVRVPTNKVSAVGSKAYKASILKVKRGMAKRLIRLDPVIGCEVLENGQI